MYLTIPRRRAQANGNNFIANIADAIARHVPLSIALDMCAEAHGLYPSEVVTAVRATVPDVAAVEAQLAGKSFNDRRGLIRRFAEERGREAWEIAIAAIPYPSRHWEVRELFCPLWIEEAWEKDWWLWGTTEWFADALYTPLKDRLWHARGGWRVDGRRRDSGYAYQLIKEFSRELVRYHGKYEGRQQGNRIISASRRAWRSQPPKAVAKVLRERLTGPTAAPPAAGRAKASRVRRETANG